MATAETKPTETLYEIEHESFNGKGPFTGEQIDAMVQGGEITKNQKVRKVHTGKVIDARFALLSAQTNDQPPSPPSKGKFFAGVLLLLAGLAVVAFLIYAKGEGERVRGKLFLIPGAMVLGGASMMASNSKAFRAGQSNGEV